MKLLTFLRGGVHPRDRKLSAGSRIEDITLPEEFIFPMAQHIGTPATPAVKPKDKVRSGTIIGRAAGACSAHIHSSISGVVKTVDKNAVTVTRKDEEYESVKISRENKLIDIVREAGIVGMGGAAFPTHIKLSPPKPEEIDIIIINAAECEPYLTADHRLILEEGEAVIDGIKLIQDIFPKKPKVYIGIEANKMDAFHHLKKLIEPRDNIEPVVLKTMYPQGGERQLIQAILKREVPSGGFPFNIGVIVQNVGTAFAIHEAYREGKPLYERIVTVSGDLTDVPKNYRVPIGTPISHLMDISGVDREKINKIVIGGPMMGKTTTDLKLPVTKAVSGVLFFGEEACVGFEERDCISCGICLDKCPAGLIPSRLAMLSRANKVDEAIQYGTNDCMECGCCAYSCPAEIKIVQWIQLMKDEIIKELKKRDK